MNVDVHAHLTPPEYLELVRTMGGSYKDRFTGFVDPISWSDRLAMMAEAEIGRQVLSPTTAPYSENLEESKTACELVNNIYAGLKREQPEQFDFWVSLPLPHVDAALEELRRGMDELDGVGVVLACFCLGESMADERFEPIYEEMNRRHCKVFFHPCQNGICSDHINEFGLTICAGASLEDSTVAMQLILRQIPLRYPNIRFIIPHLSKAALLASLEAFGAEQLVTGSDFPVLLRHESYKQTFDNIRKSGISQREIDIIMANAYKLLYDNQEEQAAAS